MDKTAETGQEGTPLLAAARKTVTLVIIRHQIPEVMSASRPEGRVPQNGALSVESEISANRSVFHLK